MTTDSPFEGDVPDGGGEPSYEWIDEWLCEYVDGTMDPSLETVFEKYVEANPDLKAHVQRLQETRDLLCNCGLPGAPSSEEVEAEICREVESDVSEDSLGRDTDPSRRHPVAAVGLISSVAAALIVGFLVGAMVVGPLPTDNGNAGTAPSSVATDTKPTSVEPLAPARRSTPPVATTDSARAPSTLTPIGMP